MTDQPDQPVHGCTIGGQPAIPVLLSEYQKLTAELAALRAVARGYCPACGRGDAAPSVADWEQQKQRADQVEELLRIAHDTSNKSEAARARAAAALARVRDAAALHRKGLISTAELHAVIGPATTATEAETTTRVFAALHQSAEQDVSRVIALYERWVKAGPPPLGTPIARWRDARLAELHDAILPPDAAPDVGGGA